MARLRTPLLALLAVGLLVFSAAPSLAREAASPRLVTLAPGADVDDVARDHGARVLARFDATRVALLAGGDRSLASDARVVSLESDATVRSIAANGAAWDGAAWDGAAWDGAAWDGAAWDGAAWDGAARDGAAWDGAAWDGAAWDGAAWDGAAWDGAAWDGAAWDGGSWDDAPSLPWWLAAIDAPGAWQQGVPRANRVACVVDSGIDADHPALARALWRGADGSAGRDFVDDDATPQDEFGHGTHLAGILSAAPGPFGLRGVSAAAIASARVLGADGTGSTSDVIAAIDWCVGIRANVMLFAFTEDAPTRALERAVAAAQKAGILVIASAGNEGPCADCVSAPGSFKGVLAVGALRADATVAPFSSDGREVALLAPGVGIVSTVPGGGYRAGSGTSQAAALAAGVAALVWSQSPDLTAREIARILDRTSHDGVIDADAASRAGVGA